MEKEQARKLAKQLTEQSPQGDWYLLPHGARNVVGYITSDGIGEVAYKGKPMNIQAVLEEAIYTALVKKSLTNKEK